ncbi:hypothetical protein QOG_2325 [Clostridioides difficile Y10]|uniref:hypothetical protein n=1 Tax=Clostridioides difficile TaxID=1496 RepID=UPI00038D5435|nr:hypothetical protein [Clostridioides difficile]EQI05218.1 hypothetical protein QOG_2325 [Clostridioides difficile Y10]
MSNINNKNKSWIEKHKILTIFISVIAILIICIGLPSLINRVLYWDIKTHNSTDGEWLSFWGSFLGGIFGGLATLGAILITREMAKKDNEELKESISMEREPKVIPIKKMHICIKLMVVLVCLMKLRHQAKCQDVQIL